MSYKGFDKNKNPHFPAKNLSKKLIERYRESLLNKNDTLKMAKFYIQQAVKDQKSRIEDGENPPVEPEFWLQYFKHMLESDTMDSIDFIFKYSESPIETIFLNSLLLSFITIQPLSLVITPPPAQNALASIDQFREDHQMISELWDYFQQEYSNNPLGNFIDYARNKYGEDRKDYLLNHVIKYLIIPFSYNLYHLTMQANFPSFLIDGKSIRTDISIWIPGDKDFKLIVECDGFQYHSKDTFTSDRKRDRLFQREGYEVLRYSGSEIHRNPFEVSWDLFTYLQSRINLNLNS